MNRTTTAVNGVMSMTREFVNDNLDTIMAGVKVYRRIYRDTFLALKAAEAALTPEFEASLKAMKEIRVSVFISTIVKAGLVLKCKLFHEGDPVVSVTSVSQLSSILAAAYDNDEAGLIAKRAKMFEPTLVKAINQPGELTMSQLIKICQAAGLELSVK